MKSEKFRNLYPADWLLSGLVLTGFVLTEVALAIYIAENSIVIFLIILAVLTGGLVYWHSRFIGYDCSNCHHKFRINAFEEFVTINGFNRKYVKCPKCGQRSWMEILRFVT